MSQTFALAVTDAIISRLCSGGFMGINQFTDNKLSHMSVPNSCGVYLLKDLVTGATYVGASRRIRTRLSQHFADMGRRPNQATYRRFLATYKDHGAKAFDAELLEICTEDTLLLKEKFWIDKLQPTENLYVCTDGRTVYGATTLNKKAATATALWANQEYRQKAVASRVGKAYNKGYKCTPEQIENRKKAARMANMRRWYGEDWKAEYVRRYPEYAGDVNG